MPHEALFQRTQLPRPDVTADEAAEILSTFYNLTGSVRELGSQQDRNYRIDTDEGSFVLKICHADYATSELEAQNAALRHVAAAPFAPRVPLPVPAVNGDDILFIAVGGQDYQVRLLTYVEGEQLTRYTFLAPVVMAELGALAGRLTSLLSDFDHPGLDRQIQWDLRLAGPVALHLLSTLTDQARRDRIAKAMVAAMRRVQPLTDLLRVSAVHHDLTDDNVVALIDEAGRPMPDGVIDFGDLIRGWIVGDLAVTAASLLHHVDGDPMKILPAVVAYHTVCPLTEAEARALWPLIVARAGVLVASSERQLAIDPDNSYVGDNIEHEREIFEVALSVPMPLMEAAILKATGFDMPGLPLNEPLKPLLPGIDGSVLKIADLSILSADLDRGYFAVGPAEKRILEKTARDTGISMARYGEGRFTRTRVLSAIEPETVALHVAFCLPASFQLAAPFAGRLDTQEDRVVLSGEGKTLHITGLQAGVENGTILEAGAALGTVAGEAGQLSHMTVQLAHPAITPPLFCQPSRAEAWKALVPDPSPLFGFACAAPTADDERTLALRKAHFAKPQKNYYAHPPLIERGWKEHMFDMHGRAYLDMLNNVSILGHGHPKLAEAVARQWTLLNTNSRFHYSGVADYSARLASLAPEGLDCVFLVNSGSEANDLALRLAWAHTGQRNMLCLLEAYHGWTVASDAVSTSIADNPRALETRPDWVLPVLSPNSYRGAYRGQNSTSGYVEAVLAVLQDLHRSGKGLAGFISETVYGNAGGIPLPPGYLAEVYAMVRDLGGLCIADEVQVGFGRLGHYFWGFEEQGVVPDIITVAKGMGNGHPLGAVITTRAIAESLEQEGYFFSSSGGSPVSCTVGMTVLDIMRDEGLQDNARVIGDHLKARLEELSERHPIAGAVHGMGLYLGLEFVRDRETLAPATEETAAICDRLLDFGILMQPTGDHLNVLKIKPPLCLSRESADYFCDMLDRVLTEGW